jgi:hypothetical protein
MKAPLAVSPGAELQGAQFDLRSVAFCVVHALKSESVEVKVLYV